MTTRNGWGSARSRSPIFWPSRPSRPPTDSFSLRSSSPRRNISTSPIFRRSGRSPKSNCGIRCGGSNDALFGNPKRLDRELWLSRFSDLMLSGIQFPANSPIDLAAWRRAVREGRCGIYLRGYSHIFVSGPSDSDECSELVAVAEADNSYQEVFSRSRLRELVMSYWKDSDPIPVRRASADQDIWLEQAYRKPSERIEIVRRRKRSEDSSNDGGSGGSGSGSPPEPSSPPAPPSPA